MIYGYARVSTIDQQTHAQTDALKAAGCEVIYSEKRSGGTMARPELQALLWKLKKGDVVIVYKLDRIARSLRDLLYLEERIRKAGADFRSLTEAMDTTSAAGRMIFQILGAFAEFERAIIRERTIVGLHAAMERGAKPGRPCAVDREEVRALWLTGDYSRADLARRYGVHTSSIKRACVA